MAKDYFDEFLRALGSMKIEDRTVEWQRPVRWVKTDEPTDEMLRTFEQIITDDPTGEMRRAFEQWMITHPDTDHLRAVLWQRITYQHLSATAKARPGLDAILVKPDAKEGPDEPDENQTAGPSLELRQDIQASRVSAVVHAPPERAEKFLHFILPCDRAEDRIGDLEEKFHKAMVPKYGYQTAVRWYWVQVALIAGDRLRVWVGMSIGSAIGWLIGKIGS